MKKIFLRLLLISLAASAFAGIFILLFGEFRETEVKILLTTINIAGCSLTGLCSSLVYDTRHRIFSIVGMATTGVSFIFILLTIWVDAEILLNNWKVLESLLVLSVSFAQISLLLIEPVTNKYVSYLLIFTVNCISIVAALLVLVISGVVEDGEYYYRILGAFAILDVTGTIAVAVLGKMQKPS